MEMQDEVRVTVVATGLNRVAARQPVKDGSRIRPTLIRGGADAAPQSQPAFMLKTGTGPSVLVGQGESGGEPQPASPGGIDYLDIPAFLRRQAD